MLRAIQTSAISNKVAEMFETLTASFKFEAEPSLADGPKPSYNWSSSSAPRASAVRRRRIRRRRLASPTASIRSAWF